MAFLKLVSAGKGATDTQSATTDPIDTTGCDLIVIAVSSTTGYGTLSDSEGNTWSPLTGQDDTLVRGRLYYCYSPATDAAHTFTITQVSGYPSIAVIGFSGSDANPFDGENGTTGTNSAQPGSVTPSENNCLVVNAVAFWDSSSRDISGVDGSFTQEVQIAKNGDHFGVGLAYLIQTSAAAANPTTTFDGSVSNWANAIAVFQDTGGAPPDPADLSGSFALVFSFAMNNPSAAGQLVRRTISRLIRRARGGDS